MRRVAHEVHGQDSAEIRDGGDSAAGHENGLEGEGSDVADEGHDRIHLARVAGATDRDPPDEQGGEGDEPCRRCNEREQEEQEEPMVGWVVLKQPGRFGDLRYHRVRLSLIISKPQQLQTFFLDKVYAGKSKYK